MESEVHTPKMKQDYFRLSMCVLHEYSVYNEPFLGRVMWTQGDASVQ